MSILFIIKDHLLPCPITDNSIGKHRDLQRVTVPYAKLLGVLHEESGQGDAMET